MYLIDLFSHVSAFLIKHIKRTYKMDKDKKKIVDLFYSNVKGKRPAPTGNTRHDGRSGHWLEQQMGIPANASNEPDLYGYEMKNATSSGKTTFGDWSANYYIFNDSLIISSESKQFLQRILATINTDQKL